MLIITGYGPRTGTSFVMRQLRDAGYDVLGNKFTLLTPDGPLTLPEEGNPDGYYEAPHFDLSLFEGVKGIMKAWGPNLVHHNFRPTAVITLSRSDEFSQCTSIYEQSERENRGTGLSTPPAWNIIERVSLALDTWLVASEMCPYLGFRPKISTIRWSTELFHSWRTTYEKY